MSEDPERLEEEELEQLLRRLKPAPLEYGFGADLKRERERFEMERSMGPSRVQWSKVVPLVLVGTVAMFGFALHRYGEQFRKDPAQTAASEAVQTESLAERAEPVRKSPLQPVSVHGTVLRTTSGGIVETESGPQERLSIEYGDGFHWHDPDSGTNIRLFRPRTEEVVVPLSND